MQTELGVEVVGLVVRKHLLSNIVPLTKAVAAGDVARRQHVIQNLDKGKSDPEVNAVIDAHKNMKRSDLTDWMMQNGLF